VTARPTMVRRQAERPLQRMGPGDSIMLPRHRRHLRRTLGSLLPAVLGLFVTLCADAAPDWRGYQQKPNEWYHSPEAARIITNVLSWQSAQGLWPKNLDTTRESRPAGKTRIDGTFDNAATTGELRFLARAYRKTADPACREAVLRGLDAILAAQYPTGGWAQSYPREDGYHSHITFNDDVMVHVLKFLCDVGQEKDFDFVGADRRAATREAFERGIECILQCQIRVNGRLTVWCAQHDEVDFRPRAGRSFELVSLSGSESAGVLRLLMSLPNPSPRVARAINAGAEWFASARLEDIRVVHTDQDCVVIQDPSAPPLWARFYEIDSNRPIFSGRDGVKRYRLSDIERERRTGYAWYGSWGTEVAREYAHWRERWPAMTNSVNGGS